MFGEGEGRHEFDPWLVDLIRHHSRSRPGNARAHLACGGASAPGGRPAGVSDTRRSLPAVSEPAGRALVAHFREVLADAGFAVAPEQHAPPPSAPRVAALFSMGLGCLRMGGAGWDGRLVNVRIVGFARAWIGRCPQRARNVMARQLLTVKLWSRPPGTWWLRGRTVCHCWNPASTTVRNTKAAANGCSAEDPTHLPCRCRFRRRRRHCRRGLGGLPLAAREREMPAFAGCHSAKRVSPRPINLDKRLTCSTFESHAAPDRRGGCRKGENRRKAFILNVLRVARRKKTGNA